MATSGQLNTNTDYDSYFWVKWEQLGNQDIANNRTQIKWACGVYCGHDFKSNAIKMSAVSINGSNVYGGGTYSNFSKGNHTIASGTMWIGHNADGGKTFSISSFTGWLYSNHNYSCNGGNFALTQIPRQAKITSANSFTDVDNPSFTFSNPGGFPMDVWLEPNPVSDHLCVRTNIANTGSYQWTLTDAEREELRNKCTGKPSCTIRVGLYTRIGNTTYADYKDLTYTMTENNATKPTVALTVALNNDSLPSTFDGMYIQNKSRLDVSLSAQGKYGASISSVSVTIGRSGNSATGVSSLSFTSNVLENDGKVEIIGSTTDSRRFYNSVKQEIEVVPYSKPLVIPIGSASAIQCYRSDANGKRVGNSTSVWIRAKRTYYSLSGKNKCVLQWRKKLAKDVWDDKTHLWQDLIPKTDTTTTEYNAILPNEVFDVRTSYSVQIRAIDDIGEIDVKNLEIPTQDVALHLGKGGKNVSVGTYCDYSKEYTFYSDWDVEFDKNASVGESLSVTKSISVGGNQMADFIIARGTSGIWTYEKWASGKAECWAKFSYEVEDLGDTKKDITVNLSFPFTFTNLPTCNLTLANQANWNHYLSSCDFTKAQFTKFSIYRGGSGSTVAVSGTADIRAIGKWK